MSEPYVRHRALVIFAANSERYTISPGGMLAAVMKALWNL